MEKKRKEMVKRKTEKKYLDKRKCITDIKMSNYTFIKYTKLLEDSIITSINVFHNLLANQNVAFKNLVSN